MSRALTPLLLFAASCGIFTGCTAGPSVPARDLFAAQRHARALVASQQALSSQFAAVTGERDNLQMLAQALESEKDSLGQHIATLESDLGVANSRVENLLAERNQLQQRYASLLEDENGVLSDSVAGRFQDLASRYPDLDFDPQTGMSRFNGQILFDSGSADLKPESRALLQEFAAILNDAEAGELKILVVGHTDDERVAKPTTRAKHPTNWHLSTDRADTVVLALAKLGISEERMAAMGYSKYQPATDNYDDAAREMNRRVEIFILAPDAVLAQWDPKQRS